MTTYTPTRLQIPPDATRAEVRVSTMHDGYCVWYEYPTEGPVGSWSMGMIPTKTRAEAQAIADEHNELLEDRRIAFQVEIAEEVREWKHRQNNA